MKSLAIAIVAILISFSVDAQQKEDMNFKGERKRVKQGIKSGEVTKREAKSIRKHAEDVKRAKVAAKADGKITAKERARIAKQDRQLDRTIYRKKHNNKKRK